MRRNERRSNNILYIYIWWIQIVDLYSLYTFVGRDSSAGVTTRHGLEDPGI
jgi:hypothetical protein